MYKILLLILALLTTTLFSYSQCSYISGILVNACGGSAEGINEMITVETGADPISWDDISITFPSAGTYCNSCTKTWTTNSTYVNNILEPDCPSENLIIEIGVDTDTIPANSRLIIFTGNPPTFDFDFSNLCGTGPYYVMFADNIATTGRYANSANADRTTTYTIGSCNNTATYYSSSTNTGTDGDAVIFDSNGNPTYVNSCDAIPIINPPIAMSLDTTKIIHTQIIKDDEPKIIMSIHNLLGQQLHYYDYNSDNKIALNSFKQHGTLIIRYTDLTVKKIIIK